MTDHFDKLKNLEICGSPSINHEHLFLEIFILFLFTTSNKKSFKIITASF